MILRRLADYLDEHDSLAETPLFCQTMELARPIQRDRSCAAIGPWEPAASRYKRSQLPRGKHAANQGEYNEGA